jgi:3-oxoadipate enol-lactonase
MRKQICIPLLLLAAACATAGKPPRASAPPADSGWLPVEGGRLYYETLGQGAPVVLLHGAFGDRRMWDDQLAALAEDFRVVRYDHRGFGRSPAPEGPYSPVRDLLLLLDHLRIERAHLVGNSMGGALALDFALLHPERADRLAVLSSGANGYPYPPEDIERVAAVFRAAAAEGTGKAVELWLQHPMVAVASQDAAVGPRLRTMALENRDIFLMRHWPAETMSPPAFARLQEIQRPVAFLLGEQDTARVLQAARESADRIPGVEWRVIAGADHLLQMERPQEVNAFLREFLRAR